MKLVKSMMIMIGLVTVVMYAKQMNRLPAQNVPAGPSFAKASEGRPDITNLPEPQPKEEWVAPDISTLPAPLNISPEGYASSKVAAVSQQLVRDIFPRTDTIERIVFEFRDEYPGSFKETDITILYNAIINDPEIKKFLTINNATSVYNFIKDALGKAWDKKEE